MKFEVNGTKVTLVEDETLIAGSVGIHRAEFMLDETWSKYTALTAVFRNGLVEREIMLENGECEIPWEVLSERGTLQVGIYGATGEKIRPTLWAAPQTVHPGAMASEESREPTPDKWQQVLKTVEEAEYAVTPRIASDGIWYVGDRSTGVKARGDNGKDGADGKDGDNYILTEADKAEIALTVLAALPDGDEVSY